MGTQYPSPDPVPSQIGAESLPPPKKIRPCLLWPNGWMDQYGTWHGDRPQLRQLCVRWGPSPSPKRGRTPSPIFGPFLLWPNRQMPGCIKMPLGMEIGLSLGDCVRWGPSTTLLDPAPLPKKGGNPPNFRSMFIVANGFIDQDGTWHGGRPQPRRLSVRWGHSPPPQKGGGDPSSIFGPFLLRPNGWMHPLATWYGGRPHPRELC